jgi:ankyrin repeat protein
VSATRALIAHGAKVTARETRYFGTPIGWATYARHQEVVDLLLESGPVDIFDAVEHGRSDLVRAAVERDPAALDRPLGDYLGVEPPDWLQPWWRPLTFAKEHGKEEMVRVLLDLGATEEVRSEGSSLGAEP